ncbi:hypothetical protein N7533_010818 [Penicillium manginii]|uniref:uncharacterized protein n=1 Tax=Penicillium manginii TaxID=203109 RepID=UPI0025467091|nr:uncharacterized protein N7533_010818 [Penicillium manginii]KAJ5741409.1 hypothetical protein N7533_010818 [Penicillium manginii]
MASNELVKGDRFPPWQAKGRKLRQWMEASKTGERKIRQSSLRLRDLDQASWIICIIPKCLPLRENLLIRRVGGLPTEWNTGEQRPLYKKVSIRSHQDDVETPATEWYGFVGLGMLSISWVFRPQEDFVVVDGQHEPYISEISKAVYENSFPLDTLKYVFVTGLSEDDTKQCLNYYISSDRRDDLFYESWEYTEPQCDALLGTKIGKTVAYLLLGAFGQGVKRVRRIAVISEVGQDWDLRFDIEDVPLEGEFCIV